MKDSYTKIFEELINLRKNDVEDEKDFDEETQKQIIVRDEKYSQLLDHFVDITKRRNDSKERNKWFFFWILMAMLVLFGGVSSLTVIIVLLKADTEQIVRSVPALVTAIAGFASTVIAIPLTITKYLFSTDEDKYITTIISHTQEHDVSSRKILKAIEQAMDVREEEKAIG